MSDFFQSAAWERFQRNLGAELITGKGTGWRYYARVQRDAFGPYLYVPGGPVVTDTQALDAALSELRSKARACRAIRVVVEPTPPITPADMASRATRPTTGFRHSRTQTIDLTQSWDDIFSDLNASRRKQFRGAEKRGIEFTESRDKAIFDKFVDLYQGQGDAGGFEVRDVTYFDTFYESLVLPGIARMFVARQHEKIEVIGITIDDTESHTRFYLYVGRDLSNNSLQVSSPFITWMIRDAKDRGFHTFDLFGVSASDDVEDEATGYTVFKRTFGGETQTFAGTWEIAIAPVRYRLWRAAHAAAVLLRGNRKH